MDKYMVIDSEVWDEATRSSHDRPEFRYSEKLLDMDMAGRVAAGKAKTRDRVQVVLKVTAVSLHRAKTTTEITTL